MAVLINITLPPPTNQATVPSSANKALANEAEPIEGQYLVIFNERWQNIRTHEVAGRVQGFIDEFLNNINIPADSVVARFEFALRGFTARISEDKAEALENNPLVDYVVQDRRFRAISSTDGSKAEVKAKTMTSLSQTTPWGITRVNGPLDGTGKKAWILDTGIDLDHDDLNVDTDNSASFIADESADDFNGHGTHVAGILAAINNTIDVVGVAAGASVVSVKVLDQNGNGTITSVCNGIDHVTANASLDDVINMSLGGGADPTIDQAVTNAADTGLRFAIAGGNSADHASNYSPARVNHSNVYTVSAFRQGDEFAETFDWNTPNCNPAQDPNGGSNYGNPPTDYAGPGESVLSLWKNNGTFTTCGTSMAAPHIAGLLLAAPHGIDTDGTVSGDPDGDPDPIAVAGVDQPLSVSISGPQYLNSGESGTWIANVSNNEGSISYEWFRRETLSDPWNNTGVTSSSYSTHFYNLGPTDKHAAVKAEVTSAGEFDSASKGVIIASEDCNTATGNDEITTMDPDPCY